MNRFSPIVRDGRLAFLLFAAVILSACAGRPGEPAAAAAVETVQPSTVAATRPPAVVATHEPPTPTPLPTATPTSTASATPAPTATITPTATATPDRTISCSRRLPHDDLLTIVTLTYGLSRDYEPGDLVLLTDYLPVEVTLGYPSELRRVALEPLLTMIDDMIAAGLRPQVISGYRSYYAQSVAYGKWQEKHPDHVSIISAPPGFSEHQLGTVVDFGSPELEEIVGEEGIEFHTYFYKTAEGLWLAENAHRYGFTLSYPVEAFETTGFYYEPWHYRYVGVEMATRLKEMNMSLTEYQLSAEPPPCVPEAAQ